MKSAYNTQWLYNLSVVKETKRWFKQGFIDAQQLTAIHEQYKCEFYHPNFIIRILLFVATLLAISGVTGFFALIVIEISEEIISTACVLYGLASFFVLEQIFIVNSKHYKSGVNEAIIYHACGFTIGGLSGLTDFNTTIVLFSCLFVFSFAAIRYLDLICTVAATGSFAGVLFHEFYNFGGIFQQIIPFVFITAFTPLYFLTKKMKESNEYREWHNNLIIVESFSLLLVYIAGNYLVVRELSIELMGLSIEEGTDMPFAFIFYGLTILIPISYLYYGIKLKDIVLLRVSLFVFAFSVFTFKYYYGFGHPEISLTIAGALLIAGTITVLRYLKDIRNGFTRENLLEEKWGNMNVQAILISQTLGGNEVVAQEQFQGSGGEFGGGGASGTF